MGYTGGGGGWGLIGPAVIYVDDEDTAYIPEHNGGLVSVMTLEGERLAQWGSTENRSCHGIWVDSLKDLYVVMPGPWGRNRRVVKFFRKGWRLRAVRVVVILVRGQLRPRLGGL
jgi:hypothetical protein